MPEYTYEDIIIDPEDPRIELGKEYYINDAPSILLDEARKDFGTVILKAVYKDQESPFVTDLGYSYYCIIRKKEPSYAERQAKWIADNGIKVGDYVRVVRKADSHEDGWNNGWVDNMTYWVGKVFKVNYFNDTAGIQLLDNCGADCGAVASFPYFVLEKVKQKYVPFDLSDKKVRDELRGKWIKNKNNNFELCITVFTYQGHVGNTISADIYMVSGIDADELLKYWVFEDGTPCGKLEANQ